MTMYMIQHISLFNTADNCLEDLFFDIINDTIEIINAHAKANIKKVLKLFVRYKKAIIVETLKKHMKARGLFLNSSILVSPY